MKKAENFRSQSDEELLAQCRDLRREIFEMRGALASKKADVKSSDIQVKKRNVARILTILREREQQQVVQKII
jgi:ribosomal protein L29